MNSHRSTKPLNTISTGIGAILVMALTIGCAKKPLADYPLISSRNGVALNGYDVIAYYDLDESDRAVRGRTNFASNFEGLIWYFDTAGNASEFIGSPADYMPLYNGYAADVLASKGELIESNPHHWGFFGNDLYLFRSRSGLVSWQQGDWQSFKRRADENFAVFIALKNGAQ